MSFGPDDLQRATTHAAAAPIQEPEIAPWASFDVDAGDPPVR